MSLTRAQILKWDTGNWAAALDFWERYAGLHGALDCLEVGAHEGGLSVWLASRGHRVLCSDVEDCEALARPLVERVGLIDRIAFEDIDATAIPYENRFDIIAFKSVLGAVGRQGAINRQRAAIGSMHRALRPGGRLLFAENLVGSPMHQYLRSRFAETGGHWRYVTIEEMRDFLRNFCDIKCSTGGVLGTLGRSELQRRMLAAIDRTICNAVVPPAWRYIFYGVATK